jgi:hypothetical protein
VGRGKPKYSEKKLEDDLRSSKAMYQSEKCSTAMVALLILLSIQMNGNKLKRAAYVNI